MNKVAVVCRGKSLAGISFLPDDIDLYVLVNTFGNELEINEIGSYFMNKRIHHIVSRTPGESDSMIRRGQYTKYNIEKVIQPYTTHMKNPNDFSDGRENHKYFKFIDEKFYFCGEDRRIPADWLGDHHIEYMDDYQRPKYPHHYPSSGNAGIGYSVLDLNPKELYIIGMDFYDIGTHGQHNRAGGYLDGSISGGAPEDGERMKNSLTRFVDSKSEINFTVITCGSYEHSKENLEVIKLEDA
tara:strand:- start:42 stop:764 length:723 start_codon:yes stop_codon:yes gene_type:complete